VIQERVVRLKGLPKQKEFLKATEREVLYSGAWGAGKTLSLCVKCVSRAVIPNAREGLFRFTLKQLKKTTLVTLLEGDGNTPPILPLGTYEHHKQEQRIDITDGGCILYGDLEDAAKIGSMNLTGAGIDEASEVSEDRYTAIRGRIRVPLDGLPNQLYSACNPAGPHHHLARRFGLSMDYACSPGCRAIRTETMDNPHLPADYLADLQTMTGVAYKRFVKGLWVAADGLVYENYEPSVHAAASSSPVRQRVIAVDEGTANPFAALCLDVDGDGRVHVSGEVYKSRLLQADKRAAIKRLAAIDPGCPVDAVVVDPSALDLIQELRTDGWNVVKAQNDVLPGIRLVEQRLSAGPDGRPRLTHDPSCVKLAAEFQSYEWSKDITGTSLKDKPKKDMDHALDALRYGIAHLDMGSPIVAVVAGATERTQAPAGETARGYLDRMRRDPNWGFDEE
jgi:PBSX family phage terminase large subunit